MKNQVLFLMLILTFVSCKNESSQEPVEASTTNESEITATKEQFENEKMVLGKLSNQPFEQAILTSGMIDVPPHNKANISTFMGGYVVKTPLLVGDRVRQGQLLVTLENTDYVELQQQYLELTEQLAYLKNEFERQKTLYDEKISSQKNYLQAESNYKSSLAHQNGLKKKLQMLNINPVNVENGQFTSTINLYAPIDGNVSKVNVSNGSYVSPADVILELVDTDHIHLELSVFEKDIMHLKKGQTIRFKIPEASNETYEAEVHLVGTTIDETTRRVKVHGHLKNENEPFVVGMFVEASIITSHEEQPALPNLAIAGLGNDSFVLVLSDSSNDVYTFEKQAINVGKTSETYTQILSPEVLEGKTILLKGIDKLIMDEDSSKGHNH